MLRLLGLLDLEVVAYDPYLPAEEAKRLRVRLVGLQELFRDSDVVSVHAPLTGRRAA